MSLPGSPILLPLSSELKRITNHLNIDITTKSISSEFLQLYLRSKPTPTTPAQKAALCGAAVYLAGKTQVMHSIGGEEVVGIGLGVLSVVKATNNGNLTHESVKTFLEMVTQSIPVLKLGSEITQEVKKITVPFSLIHLVYIRFQDVSRQVNLTTPDENSAFCIDEDYNDNIRTFSWLIFVLLRQQNKKYDNNVSANAEVMLGCILYCLIWSDPKIDLKLGVKGDSSSLEPLTVVGASKKQSDQIILERLCQALGYPFNNEVTASVGNTFTAIEDKFFEIFRQDKEDLINRIADQERINDAIREVETLYRTMIGQDEIDETIFVKNCSTMTPLRFTPFTKQAIATHKLRKLNQSEHFELGGMSTPGRTLETPTKPISIQSKLMDTINSPSVTGVWISTASRLGAPDNFSRSIELNQWLKDKLANCETTLYNNANGKTGDNKENHSGSNEVIISSKIFSLMGGVDLNLVLGLMSQVQKDLRDWVAHLHPTLDGAKLELLKSKLITLFLCFLNMLLTDEMSKHGFTNIRIIESDQSFLRSVAGLALEIYSFVFDDSNVTFAKILKTCNLNAFDVWKVIVSFDKVCTDKPSLLIDHLYMLEMQSFLELFWMEKSALVDTIKSQAILQTSLDQNKSELSSSEVILKGELPAALGLSHSVFFKRFLQLAASRIHNICSGLGFKDKQMELVWAIVKFVVCEHVDLLLFRHLDQIIICAIYAVSMKTSHYQGGHKKFSEIFQSYERLHLVKSDINEKNIYGGEGKEPINLRELYNGPFMVKVKDFISKYNSFGDINPNSTPVRAPKKNMLQKMQLDSPFRQAIPQNKSVFGGQGAPLPFSCLLDTSPIMSPMTRTLYAHETPCLADKGLQLTKRLSSTKKINFEQLGDAGTDADTSVRTGSITPSLGLPSFGGSIKPSSNFLLSASIENLRETIKNETSTPELRHAHSFDLRVEVATPLTHLETEDDGRDQPGTPSFF